MNGSLDCTIFQHTVSDLFRFILRGAATGGETDQAFLTDVVNKLTNIDKGAHIGSWGQVRAYRVLRGTCFA